MIMNYQLMSEGFLPVSIAKENRLKYYDVLDEYASTGKIKPFADMIAEIELERLKEYLSLIPCIL